MVMTVQSVVLKVMTLHIFEDGCQHVKKCAVCFQGQNGQLDTEGRDSMLLQNVGVPSKGNIVSQPRRPQSEHFRMRPTLATYRILF